MSNRLLLSVFFLLSTSLGYTSYKEGPDTTQLHDAVREGNLKQVKTLIESGKFSVDEYSNYGQTPLMIACSNGDERIVNYLLSKGANYDFRDSDGGAPILNASAGGHIKVVKKLIENGADIEAQDHQYRGVISYAAYSGNLDLMKF